MGTDAPNIRRIIHFGPPSSLETYLQEIGRGGRDGAQCIATLFYNANDIGSNVKNMKEEVKLFCALKTCRRKFITDHFGFSYEQNMTPHTCCDVCELKCQCDKCIVAIADKIENDVAMESTASSRKTKNSALLVEVLSSYFDTESSQLDIPNPDVFTGLSKSLLTGHVSIQLKIL
ncbi:putative ATP-dependent DNA helicase Q1 [Saccostrea cucullata]|uniref:putative ATP-dependent DNA helicase Q1 n=1 Tax=Saccostrea cuccullata TaxID=36930 RepID=UPI002ED4ADEE